MTHLRKLHLLHEAGAQVLQDNAIRSRKESQHVHDEVFLVCAEALPVAQVISEIDLLSCTYGNVDTPSAIYRGSRQKSVDMLT